MGVRGGEGGRGVGASLRYLDIEFRGARQSGSAVVHEDFTPGLWRQQYGG